MFVHLTPTFYCDRPNIKVSLKRLVVFTDDYEYEFPIECIKLVCPFPNKSVLTVCSKESGKTVYGVLGYLNEKDLKEFDVYEEWEWVSRKHEDGIGDRLPTTVRHHTKFIVSLGDEFEDKNMESYVVSQDMHLWRDDKQDFHSGWTIAVDQPRVDLMGEIGKTGKRYQDDLIEDGFYFDGHLKMRKEIFTVPLVPIDPFLASGETEDEYPNNGFVKLPGVHTDGFNVANWAKERVNND